MLLKKRLHFIRNIPYSITSERLCESFGFICHDKTSFKYGEESYALWSRFAQKALEPGKSKAGKITLLEVMYIHQVLVQLIFGMEEYSMV